MAATPVARTRARRLPVSARHLGILLFTALSLMVTMSVNQEDSVEIESLSYWLFVGPAALLPLFDFRQIIKTLFGRARLLLAFAALAGTWHLAQGDQRAVMQLGLLILVLTWVSTDNAKLNVQDILRLYVLMVIIGFFVYVLTDQNKWGLIPGTTVEEYGIWRISFFPNIAYTAILSLAVLMMVTKNLATARAHPVVLGVASYFLLFSFVRAALIAAALYFALLWWFDKHREPRRMFWTAIIVAVSANLLIASSVFIVDFLQQFSLLSRFFLRGEAGLTPDEIYQQLYRPWLWWQHLTLFASSPSLMGWGAFDFFEMQTEELNVGTTPAGNEAILTKLLATYGLPGILFTIYLFVQLRRSADAGDHWACACFPAIFFLMMQWGSVFHPSDAMFTIYLLMIARGSKGYMGYLGLAPKKRARPLRPTQLKQIEQS